MADESRAVTTARGFREQLVRQEDAALREMARHWARIEKDLMDQFQLLAQEVVDMRESGQVVPDQMIYNLDRYEQMMAQVTEELQKYDADTVSIITAHQKESFNLGLDSAVATIMDTSPSSPMWNRIGADAAEVAAGFAGNGAPLGQLLQRDYGDIGKKVIDALVDGLALGKGAFATAKDMRDAMGMEYNRSVRIARTEINRAYRIANADQYAKSGVVEKVLRLCAKQANTCFACLEMDGEECPNGIVEDHPNGRCTSVVVTIGGHYPQWQKGHDWLMQQDEATQRAIMGAGRYEMWKQNGVPLRDMVKMEPNAVWGANPAIISERELRAKFNISGGNKMLFTIPQTRSRQTTPDARQQAIDNVKNNLWYKSAIGISKAPEELQRAVEGMSEEQAKVFSNGLATIKSANFNASSSYVTEWGKDVNVNLNNPKGKDTITGNKTAIRTTFHELSHGIDLFNNTKINALQGLRGKIEENALKWCNKVLDDAGQKRLTSFARISSDQKFEINIALSKDTQGFHSVSDILEGITKGRLGGWDTGGYGHGKNYWSQGINKVEKEFIAHSGQAWVTGDRFTEVFGDETSGGALQMVIDEMIRLYGN